MKEFFGFGTGEYPYGAPGDGYLSWQHIVFVSTFVVIAVVLAIILGIKNRNKDEKTKNHVLMWTAIIIDLFEITKIIIGSIHDPAFWKISLPLFLCSIQLITIPLAAFTKGRLKEASLDFVLIFGILGGLLGTYGMAMNYEKYPAFSWPNFVSAATHTISAFAALYIAISGMASMKKQNIVITYAILFGFGIAAYIANILIGYNYMFLMYHDYTPYQIFYNLVNGNKILYPLLVMSLFVIYISIFYYVFLKIQKTNKHKKENQSLTTED